MDEQLALLITSVSVNVLLVVKEVFAHIKRSKCCGVDIEMAVVGERGFAPEPSAVKTSQV